MSTEPFSPETCPHSVYEVGNLSLYRRHGDIADRPGFECGLCARGEPCTPSWDQCPRVKAVGELCPCCFQAGHLAKLRLDPESNQVHCLGCGHTWGSLLDRDREWAEMQVEMHCKEVTGCTSD